MQGLNNALSFMGIKNPSLFFLRMSVCLLFSFIPFRVLAITGLQFYPRLGLGFLLAAIIFFYSRFIIPSILDTKSFQLTFYLNLCCDEKLKSFDYIYRVPIFLVAVGSLIYLFFFIENTHSVCLFSLFYWSFYRALKSNFVSLTSYYCFIGMRLEPVVRDYFTWSDIATNLAYVSFVLFGQPVNNRLSTSLSETRFRYLIRNIFPRFTYK